MSLLCELIPHDFAQHINDYIVKPKAVITIQNYNKQQAVCTLPPTYVDFYEKIKYFTVRKDDIWLIAHPKTGSTWAKEMIWLICNNVNLERANSVKPFNRFPLFEIDIHYNNNMFDKFEAMEGPRLFKTHLPIDFLPEQLLTVKPKIIYLYRNPKAVALSYYHMAKNFYGLTGSMDIFITGFISGLVTYGDYADHILGIHKLQNESNIKLLTYEKMKMDITSAVDETCKFLEQTISDHQKDLLLDYIKINNMKDNPIFGNDFHVNKNVSYTGTDKSVSFIGKGEIDSYKDELSTEIDKKFDIWLKNKFSQQQLKHLFNISLPN